MVRGITTVEKTGVGGMVGGGEAEKTGEKFVVSPTGVWSQDYRQELASSRCCPFLSSSDFCLVNVQQKSSGFLNFIFF